jgi:hypothetical protein
MRRVTHAPNPGAAVSIAAILVGGLTLLSTLIAAIVKVRAMRAKPLGEHGQPRRFFNYPLLALISLVSQLGFAAGTLTYDFAPPAPNTIGYSVPAVFMLAVNSGMLGCWVYTMARSAQLERRDWVLNMLSGISLGSPLFSILGPTERRATDGKDNAV